MTGNAPVSTYVQLIDIAKMHFKLGSIIRQTHEAKQASAESSSHADKASACDSLVAFTSQQYDEPSFGRSASRDQLAIDRHD